MTDRRTYRHMQPYTSLPPFLLFFSFSPFHSRKRRGEKKIETDRQTAKTHSTQSVHLPLPSFSPLLNQTLPILTSFLISFPPFPSFSIFLSPFFFIFPHLFTSSNLLFPSFFSKRHLPHYDFLFCFPLLFCSFLF